MRARAGAFLRMALLWAFAMAAVLAPWRAEATGCPEGTAGAAAAADAGWHGAMAADGRTTGTHHHSLDARREARPMALSFHSDHHAAHASGAEAAEVHHLNAAAADADAPAGGSGHHSGSDACCIPGGCRMACHVGDMLAPAPVPAAPGARVLHDRRERPDPAALTAEVAVPPPRAAS